MKNSSSALSSKPAPLWKHQKTSIARFSKKPECMLDLSDPGTAKTRVQLELFSARRKLKKGCALVMCPRSLMKPAWGNDIEKFTPHLTYSIAYANVREKAFAVDADIYITNVDAAVWLSKQKPAFFKKFDTLIIDEVTAYKHHTSLRSKAANKIKKYFKYRSGLTGTPNSNTICDIWNPAQIIDDGARLGQSFFAFRSSVCAPKQVGPSAQMVKWEDKEGAEEAVFDVLRDITIRHKFEDCIDIPPTFHCTMQYDLAPKQMKAYKEMELTQMMFLQKMPVVTAINAAAVRTKLLQIASGAVYENTEKFHVVDTDRYELVMDLVQERIHPIVFFLWRHQKENIIKEAKARKLNFCVFDGTATDKQREEMVKAYQAGFYDFMLGHPASMAHGLTLTRGKSVIWPSPTDNLEWFAQGNKRQARGGQTEKTEVLVVLAPGTIEEKVYANLMNKNARMGNLLDLFDYSKAA